jgi:hypothetical protein
MIAIITGDIINSRELTDQNQWILPFKKLMNSWGKNPTIWEIFRGDSFQLEISDPKEALLAALQIKALMKSLPNPDAKKRSSAVDVRIAIGIGPKTYTADRVSESNGEAYILSGEKFEHLKIDMITLAVNSPWEEWNKEMNLFLKLAAIQMDSWSISSGELMLEILTNPDQKQAQIGEILQINQNSVSKRYKSAHAQEILELDRMFRNKLTQQLG